MDLPKAIEFGSPIVAWFTNCDEAPNQWWESQILAPKFYLLPLVLMSCGNIIQFNG